MGVGEEAREGSSPGLLDSVLSQWVPQVTQTISSAPDISQAILLLLTIMSHHPSPNHQLKSFLVSLVLAPLPNPYSQTHHSPWENITNFCDEIETSETA